MKIPHQLNLPKQIWKAASDFHYTIVSLRVQMAQLAGYWHGDNEKIS